MVVVCLYFRTFILSYILHFTSEYFYDVALQICVFVMYFGHYKLRLFYFTDST